MISILLAVLLGGAFGYVMYRSGVAHPENIRKMLSLQNMKMMRMILLAIGIALIGVFGLSAINPDLVNFSVKTAYMGVIVGGLIFGIGFALAGYCPGTCLVASGAGRKDALFFIVGGLFGALFFTWIYEYIADSWLFGKIGSGTLTLASTGSSEALLAAVPAIIPGLILGVVMIVIARALKEKY